VRINDGSVVAQAQRDSDPYRQAQEQPAFLHAVEAAYRGRWRVLDALWWASHPEAPTPEGRRAPLVRLSSLQRRAFAADGDAAGDEAVARAILELDAEITAERAALESALATAAARLSGAPVASGDGVSEPGAVGVEPEAAGQAQTPGEGGRANGRMRVAAVIGALAVGAVLGGTLTATLTASGDAADGAGAASPSDPVPESTGPVLVGRIFDRIQTTKDIPLAAMPDEFDADSFRYLGSAGWTDVNTDGVTDSPYYAARGTSGTVCLVVVPADSGYLSTCAIESAYPAAGLRLTWQSKDLHPNGVDPADAMVLDITVAWLSDSTVETRGSGRPASEP
jgi:hypothetical protein